MDDALLRGPADLGLGSLQSLDRNLVTPPAMASTLRIREAHARPARLADFGVAAICASPFLPRQYWP
jgi:hypothetical protein